ncbi:hypothetical protein FRX31_031961 [Thalictrum thalictroides]|uniref:Uncharacterized protein n=1 Tax=Thalictrum thalictroides TaxID=46969 RepID=A0A7J6V134_THATH|nr:hypothetical protein FRX31_031961 [Thalictrum thalictroides]
MGNWGGHATVFPLSKNLLGSSEICFFLPYFSANKGMKNGFKIDMEILALNQKVEFKLSSSMVFSAKDS